MTQHHSHIEKRHKQRTASGDRSKVVPFLVALSVLLVVAGAFFLFGKDQPETASLDGAASSNSAVVAVEPASLDLGTVEMSKGIVEKTFAVRSTGAGSLRITNLQTSCMCTSAQLEVAGKKSQVFGMAGHGGGHHGGAGAAPKSWSMEIPAGEEGILHVFYDPNAHGPTGVGPFERLITFDTNDPEHQNVEVLIRGVVVQ